MPRPREHILSNLESGELDDAGRSRVVRKPPKAQADQLGFFVSEPPPSLMSLGQKTVLSELGDVAVDATTPLEALNLLARWKKALAQGT